MLQWILLTIVCNILTCNGNGNISSSYSKISLGTHSLEGLPPSASSIKLFKSLSPTLDVPTAKIATNEGHISDQNSGISSGRAYPSFYSDSYRGPSNRQTFSTKNRNNPVVYRQYKPYYHRVAMDRYTPGEAVASAQFKKHKQPYHYNPPRMKPTKSPEISYTPPKDIYAFPPNLESHYIPPMKTFENKPRKPITSYVPAPAGLPDLGFLGPVNPDYLPPKSQNPGTDSDDGMYSDKKQTKDSMPSVDSNDDMLPPLNNDDSSPSDDKPPSAGKDTEPTDDNSNQMVKGPIESDMLPNIDSIQIPMKEQSSMMDDSGPSDVDTMDDMFHYHNDHSSYGSHGIDAYPEVIYDGHDHDFHDHHHDHHHDHPMHIMPPEMTTTSTMKPEPPPEPRVKKYSYFYLGRKLWYIPLYFTVWFSFYIFWLIVKSIARHKVNLPNNYTGGMRKRALGGGTMHEDVGDHIDNLTATVLNYIDQFHLKLQAER